MATSTIKKPEYLNNMRGTPVTLTTDLYVFPHDGYVVVNTNGSTSGGLFVTIRDAQTPSKAIAYLRAYGSSSTDIKSLFVRQGMSGIISENTTSDGIVQYNPLI